MMNEVLIEIRDQLKTDMTTRCKSYFVGEIGAPLKNNMPVIVVRERSTKQYRQSTAKDGFEFGIKIEVVVDIIPSMNVAGVEDRIVASRQILRKIIEEEDTDGYPKTDTILGSLGRTSNLQGTHFVYNLNPEVNYEVETPDNALYIMAEVNLSVIKTFATRKN